MGPDGKVVSPKSAYQPPQAVRELTDEIAGYYEDGEAVLNHPYEEYNGRSFVTQTNEAQRTWLSHPDAPYVGDDEWRWNGVRPLTRNRVVSTAAHLTAQLLYPKSFAQNDEQEEDRAASYAIDGLVEHAIRHSNYETAFLFGVISGLINPINYFHVEYCQSYQDAWVGGEYKRVLDEVFSGFQHSLIPVDEILFSNAYVYEWQKQDWIIRKRRVPIGEVEGKFSECENWPHVVQGRMTVSQDGFFYDVDDINDGLVGHVNFKKRDSDQELDFVNGIYLGNPNTEFNPFYHRTNKDKPEYDTVKFGFEPIDAMRFVGYKSLVDKMSNDQDAADREWQDFFDASRLSTFAPIVTMGAGVISKDVIAPSAVTEIGEKAQFKPIQVGNPLAALNALREAERSGNESSVDPQQSGQQQGPQKTKAEALILEENADTNMGISIKMIGIMVRDIGKLLVNDIVRFETVGQAGELLGETLYKTFVIDNRVRNGTKKTTYIKFTDRFAGRSMTKEEKDAEEYKLMTAAGDDKELIEVNPGVFSRLDVLIDVDPAQLMRHNSAFERAFKISVFDKAINNPLVQADPDAQLKILRDFLFEPLMHGEASKYLPRLQKAAAGVIPGEVPGNPQNAAGKPVAAGGPAGGSAMIGV